MGNYQKAIGYYRQSLAISQTIGSPEQIAICLDKMGAVSFYRGDYLHSVKFFAESHAIFCQLGNKFGQCLALGGLGWNAWVKGGPHLVEAERLMQDSLSLCRDVGNQLHVVDRIGLLCLVKNSQGEYAKSRQLCQEVLTFYQANSRMVFTALVLGMLGEAEIGLGDFKAARKHLCEALSNALDNHALPTAALILYYMAVLLIKELEISEVPASKRLEQTGAAYSIAAFVRDDSSAWQIFRDKASALIKDLRREGLERALELPQGVKDLAEVLQVIETHFASG